MSLVKTPQEIESLRRGGEILSRILRECAQACVAGVTTEELDAIARKRMTEVGAVPSFFGYQIDPSGPGFSGALCVSINDEVVHGPPLPARVIPASAIVGLDIGMWYEGLATDMATTVIVGTVSPRTQELVRDTRASLVAGLSAIKAGGFVSDIGSAIEESLQGKKYGIVRDLVGHGVGHEVHEAPQVPNYRERRAPRVVLRTGMVLAIEPMVTLGTWHVHMLPDEWTIVTDDGSWCAHFEVSVAVTDEGYELLTPWPDA